MTIIKRQDSLTPDQSNAGAGFSALTVKFVYFEENETCK
jgi:hypothetical protein